jgi:DnaK suppressor protein
MSAPISDTYAAQLLQLRAQLLSQVNAQRGGNLSRVDAAEKTRQEASDDWAVANTERDLDLAMQDHESEELAAIDAALARIKSGSYGVCLDCGVNIPTARLHANPVALRCVSCQGLLESAA